MSERYIVKSGKFGAFFFDTQAEPGRGDMSLYDVLEIMNNTPPPGYALVKLEGAEERVADAIVLNLKQERDGSVTITPQTAQAAIKAMREGE